MLPSMKSPLIIALCAICVPASLAADKSEAQTAPKPAQSPGFEHARITEAWAEFADVLTFGRGQTLALLDDGCKPEMPQWKVMIDGKPKTRVRYDAVDGDDDAKHEGRGYHGSTIGGPSSACLSIAQQLCEDSDKTGTYHFSGAPDVSWCTFARDIFAQAGRSTHVSPITTRDYPTPAARPLNSQLDCQTTEQVFGISRPNWRGNFAEIITDLGITT